MLLRLSLSTQARLFTHATHSKRKPAASLEGVSHVLPARCSPHAPGKTLAEPAG